jgi:hypothetical protein
MYAQIGSTETWSMFELSLMIRMFVQVSVRPYSRTRSTDQWWTSRCGDLSVNMSVGKSAALVLVPAAVSRVAYALLQRALDLRP